MLAEKYLFNGEDFVQGIINLHEAAISRHGVMIVGESMAGKSKII